MYYNEEWLNYLCAIMMFFTTGCVIALIITFINNQKGSRNR